MCYALLAAGEVSVLLALFSGPFLPELGPSGPKAISSSLWD